MAKGHGKKARIFVGGVDISNYLKSAASSGSQDLADSSGLNQDDKTFVVGMQEGGMTLDGMFGAKGKEAGEASLIADKLEEVFGNGAIDCVHLPQGDGFGNRAIFVSGKQSSVEITTPYSDVGKISGEVSSDVGMNSGQVLAPLAQIEAEFKGTVLDNGVTLAETFHGGCAQVHCSAIVSTPTLVVKVQHSSDNVTFSDLITFTSILAAEKSQTIALAPGTAVKRYVRALATVAGGKATFHLSFARNP
jgi:hypothetical protein